MKERFDYVDLAVRFMVQAALEGYARADVERGFATIMRAARNPDITDQMVEEIMSKFLANWEAA